MREQICTSLVLGLLLGAAACGSVTAPGVQEHAGYYESGFEVESFRPCGESQAWWVTGGESLRERYREIAAAPYERLYVVVRGTAGPVGRYGHLGSYQRELEVEEVLEIRRALPTDCGIED